MKFTVQILMPPYEVKSFPPYKISFFSVLYTIIDGIWEGIRVTEPHSAAMGQWYIYHGHEKNTNAVAMRYNGEGLLPIYIL